MKRRKLKIDILTLLSILLIATFFFKTTEKELDPMSGKLAMECEKRFFGIIETCTTYSNNGKVSIIERYRMKKLDGDLVSYYENGQLEFIIEYKNNKIWNIKEYYDIDGNKLNFGTLKNGEGELLIYSSQGNLRSRGRVMAGYKHGIWYEYNDAGLLDSVLYSRGYRDELPFLDNILY